MRLDDKLPSLAAIEGVVLGKMAYRKPARRRKIHKAGVGLMGAKSLFSILSFRSVGSILSAGSILCIASAGSVLSIGSAGSILSIGSVGSILGVGSAGYRPSREREDQEKP